MFAHVAVDVAETGEVVDLFLGVAVAHASVPRVERLHDANNAAATIATQGQVVVILIVGDEVRAVAGFLGAHGEVGGAVDGAAEGRGDARGVEGGVDVMERTCGVWMEARRRDGGVIEGRGSEFDVEEGAEARDGHDGIEVEVVPWTEIADVPPVVGVLAVPDADILDQVDGRI